MDKKSLVKNKSSNWANWEKLSLLSDSIITTDFQTVIDENASSEHPKQLKLPSSICHGNHSNHRVMVTMVT